VDCTELKLHKVLYIRNKLRMSLNTAMYWTAERIQGFLKITPQYIHKTSQSVTAEDILLQLRLKGIRTEFADCYMHQGWMFPTRKIKIFERIRCPSHYGNWSREKKKENKNTQETSLTHITIRQHKMLHFIRLHEIQTQHCCRNFFLRVISSCAKYKHRFEILSV